MKKYLIGMLLIGLTVPAMAWAADQDKPARPDRPARAQKDRPARGERGPRTQQERRPGGPLMGILGRLNLSEQQKQQVRQIFKEQREKWQQQAGEKGQQLRQLYQQLRQAQQAGNNEQVEKLRKQIAELRRQIGPPGGHGALLEQIKKVLNQEQRAKLEQWLKDHPGPRPGEPGQPGPQGRPDRPPRPEPGQIAGRLLAGLELTDEQRQQAMAILKEHHEAVMAYRQANAEQLKQLLQQMRQAKQNGDQEKVKQIAEQLRQLHQGGPSPKDLLNKLGDVLSKEQVLKVKQRLGAMLQHRHEHGKPGQAHDGKDRPGPKGDRPPRRGKKGRGSDNGGEVEL